MDFFQFDSYLFVCISACVILMLVKFVNMPLTDLINFPGAHYHRIVGRQGAGNTVSSNQKISIRGADRNFVNFAVDRKFG